MRAFERSGETHEAFCAERGLNVGSFRAWLYRLRRERDAEPDVRMVPVEVVTPAPVESTTPYELLVELATGVRVRVPVGADARYVAALIAELRAGC